MKYIIIPILMILFYFPLVSQADVLDIKTDNYNDCKSLGVDCVDAKLKYFTIYEQGELIKSDSLTINNQQIYEDETKRTKNSKTYINRSKTPPVFYTVFYVNDWYINGSQFYKIKTKKIETETLKNYLQYDFKLIPEVKADNFETGSGDGAVTVYANSTNWSTEHNATVGEYSDYTSTNVFDGAVMHPGVIKHADNKFSISRAFFPFDTSAIPDDSNISSSTFLMYVDDKLNSFNIDYYLVETSQSATDSLSLEDYDQCGTVDNPTLLSSALNSSSITIDSFNAISLNAVGTSTINKTGFTKLGLRFGEDLISDTPSFGQGTSYIVINSSESDNEPMLMVEYTEEETGTTTTSTIQTFSDVPFPSDTFNYNQIYLALSFIFIMGAMLKMAF